MGITFNSPWYLLLLLLIPLIWALSFRSLSGLGPVRRLFALGLRTLLLVLIIFSLADVQAVYTSQKLTVMYLLDQSRSIPATQRRAMLEYVKDEVEQHRDAEREDLAGVIVFGRDAAVEAPPYDDLLPLGDKIESAVDPDHTDLAAAMKLAQAAFPKDTAKRIVIVSDGNENRGRALEQAQSLAQAGISIYTVPIQYEARAEVALEKLTIPANVNRNQPFELRVVLNNTSPPDAPGGGIVKGKLKIVRKTTSDEQLLQDEPVELPPGKTVFTLNERIESPDFYTYQATLTPIGSPGDLAENNVATTFTHVRGQGQVLFIVDSEQSGTQYARFIKRLQGEGGEDGELPNEDEDPDEKPFEVRVVNSNEKANELFSSLAELQPYDTVILANVPREQFTDAQIKMLVSNTRQLGAGLIMLGGENSFGAGGWSGTELEEAMPVDFQIKNTKVEAIGALVLLMHASEMAQGNYWQKVVAQEAIKALGPQDYCGVIHWGAGGNQWLWGGTGGLSQVSGNRDQMLARIDRMTPGDMPDFDPGMALAAASFANLPPEVAVKHMIIISDGDPGPPKASTIQALLGQQPSVTVSTVAIGAHGGAGSPTLESIARQTAGKYYVVNQASALPKIYQKEVRAISRPLIFEPGFTFQPKLKFPHSITDRIADALPAISGFILTERKNSKLVETLIVSPEPEREETATILATWTYGLGKSAAFTTDIGQRWAAAWPDWADYGKLFVKLVRWSMRPPGDEGKFSVVTSVRDGRVQVVVTALDKDDQFINFLNMSGSVVAPNMQPLDVRIEQTAPGRYVGEFEAADAGSYFILLNPGAGLSSIRTGVNVPYSAEFLDQRTNQPLLASLAALTPKDGAPGVVIEDPSGRGDFREWLGVNTFLHDLPKAESSQSVWHWLVWAGGLLLFFDVLVRRVAIGFAWLGPLAARVRDKVLRRPPQEAKSETLDRLRSLKAQVTQQIEGRKAGARFEPAPDAPPLAPDATSAATPSTVKPPQASLAPEPGEDEDTYTSRLLKAKKKAREEFEGDKGPAGENRG